MAVQKMDLVSLIEKQMTIYSEDATTLVFGILLQIQLNCFSEEFSLNSDYLLKNRNCANNKISKKLKKKLLAQIDD